MQSHDPLHHLPLPLHRRQIETIVGQLKAMGELLEPLIPEVEKMTGGEPFGEDEDE